MKFSFKLGRFSLSLGGRGTTRPGGVICSQPGRKSTETSAITSDSVRSKANSPIQAWLRGAEIPSESPILVSPFQQSVWVYTVVSALAQTVSAIPFRISSGDRSGENILTKGAVVELFKRPHPSLNRFRFWEFIVTWYCLRGEAFIVGLDKSGHVLPIRSSDALRSNPPTSLLVLNPDQFRHVVEGVDLVGWRFTAAPLTGPLPPLDLASDEVIHDFLPNPYLYWRGMSPLSVAMLAAQTDYASAQYMKALMLNNADTGVIVRTDQQLSEEQREQMLAALRARKSSAGTADRPLLLWGGAEVIQPSLSTADLQFMDNRKMNRQEICAAFFRMPQSLVGFTENANRSIAESERLNFIENSITPLCVRLEAAIEPVVKSFGEDLIGWFDIDSTPILQQARRSRVDTGVKLFSLGYPVNAINKTLDLGLPHLTWGEKGYLPSGLEQAGEGVPSAQPKKEATVFDRLITTLKAACSESSEGNQDRNSKTENSHKCSADPVYEAALKPRINAKRRKLSSLFFQQRNRVLEALEESMSSTKAAPLPSDGRGVGGEGGTPSEAFKVSSIFDTAAETKRLEERIVPLLRSDVQLGCQQVKGELGRHELELSSEKLGGFVDQRRNRFEEVNQTTATELENSLQEGSAKGESLEQLKHRVKAIFRNATEARADIIAESETNSAVNTGRFFAMEAAGIEKKGWQTANDERVRAAHRQAQIDYAEGIPLTEPFIVGGEALMYPGDPNGSIGNIINCRCYTIPI